MKKLLTLALSLLFAWQASCQVEHIATYKDDLATVVKSNRNLIFTFSMVPKSWTTKDLIFYDLQGKELNKMVFKLEKGYDLLSQKAVGTHTVMCFADKDKMQLLVIDKDGKEFGKKIYEGIMVKGASIEEVDENHFVLTYEEKVKKVGRGIIATKYDVGLTDKWTYKIFPEKGNYTLSKTALNPNKDLAVMYINKNSYQMAFIDKEGKELSNKALDVSGDGISSYDPYQMWYRGAELMLVADLGYVSEGPYKSMPTGLSIMTFNSQGTRMSSSILPFMDVQYLLGDTSENGVPVYRQVAPGLRVLDIQEIDGKEKIIAESYFFTESKESIPSTTAGSPPTVVYYDDIQIRELHLIDLEDMSNIHRIWKPYVKYRVAGISVGTSDDLCELAEENKLFGYQFMQGEKIVIKGISNNFAYLSKLRPSVSFDHPSNRVHWGEVRTTSTGVSGYESKYRSQAYLFEDGLYKVGDEILIFHDHQATGAVEFKSYKG